MRSKTQLHPVLRHFRIRTLLVFATLTVVLQTAIPNGRIMAVLFLVPIVAILLGGRAYFLELLRLGIPWRFRHSAQVMALWLVVGAFMHLVMRLVCFVGIPLQTCNTGGFGTHAFGVLAFFVIFLPVALVAPSDWRRLHSSKAENKSAE